MQHNGIRSQWFAERTVRGLGDDGAPEVVTLWIERRPGAVWAVGRAVGLGERRNGTVHRDDYLFEGFEMGDALEAANGALVAELEVARGEGRGQDIPTFAAAELLEPLERWFFGHPVNRAAASGR
jgi:hypothetical protein